MSTSMKVMRRNGKRSTGIRASSPTRYPEGLEALEKVRAYTIPADYCVRHTCVIKRAYSLETVNT